MPRTRTARNLLLLIVVTLGITSTGLLGGSGQWFPQEHAHSFYVVKGLVAVTATVLLIAHMSMTWHRVTTAGQRLRYIALLMLTTLIASGSTAQLHESAPVAGRNVGALLAALLVIVAMVVSIQQDRRP